MSSERKTACAVLAAGMGKRFGSTKQLAELGDAGQTLVQTALNAAVGSRSSYVLLTLGHDASKIVARLSLGRAQIVLNKEYETGIASSVRASVSNIPADSSAAIFMVADQPKVTSEILNQLIDSYHSSLSEQKSKTPKIFALSQSGEPRNPVLITSDLFPELLDLKGDVGAREIILSHRRDLKLIEVEDPAVFEDIDVAPN
jgi:molybdenum cofactor cytidylyltransferase